MADPLLELLGQILTDPDPKARIKRTQAVYSQINGILARASFAEFVKQAWPTLEPGTHLEWNWHHQLMCDVLQAMFHAWQDSKTQRGRHQKVRSFDEYVRNAIFSVPPGSLKSRIIAVSFQPWCWLHEPSMRFICLSVNEDATLRDGRMSRDLIKSDWYQQTFRPHWSLKTDQDAISNYGNTHGGDRLSKPSGSEVVGLRGDCVVGRTLVNTSKGFKEIQNIAVGDLVESYNEQDGKYYLREVQAFRKIERRPTIKLNNELECTPDHKILTELGWLPAIYTLGLRVIGHTSFVVNSIDDAGVQDVYDIQVDENHNFVACKSLIILHNCLLIDDPNNPKEAENALERNKINELWTTNIANRVNDPRRSLRIGVQQRVHKQDWTGYVLELQKPWAPDNQFGWLNIVLPAEYDPKRKFVMPDCLRKYVRWPNAVLEDPRITEGESIHRDRFTPEYLAAEKERWKHTTNYSGQMQQSPAAAEGQLVQRKWWGWFRFAEGVREDLVTGDHPRPLQSHEGPATVVHQKLYHPGEPDFDWVTISVDPAAKKTEKGSAYGLLAIAGKGGRRFILDDRTQRGAFHEILDIIKDMIKTWKPDSILIEPKAAGPDLMDTLREQMLAGDLPMVTIEEAEPGNQDKEMRLQGALPTIKNGAVYLLEGAPWLKEFLDELSEFPASDQSDRVDALSQCLNNKRAVDDSLPGW